jgi:hypothetical protein
MSISTETYLLFGTILVTLQTLVSWSKKFVFSVILALHPYYMKYQQTFPHLIDVFGRLGLPYRYVQKIT